MTLRDAKLDPVTHDLIFGTRGSVVEIEGQDVLAQRIRERLVTLRGELLLSSQVGVPWFTAVFGKARISAATEAIRSCILRTPGVTSITSLSLQADGVSRRLTVTFSGTGVLLPGDTVTFNGTATVPVA